MDSKLATAICSVQQGLDAVHRISEANTRFSGSQADKIFKAYMMGRETALRQQLEFLKELEKLEVT